MVVKILIFNLFFILISLSTVSSGKTIFGKAKVIDGDTIHINKNKIRLHAIDAPETNQTCNKNSKVWNCGVESTKFLKELIGNNLRNLLLLSYNRIIVFILLSKYLAPVMIKYDLELLRSFKIAISSLSSSGSLVIW